MVIMTSRHNYTDWLVYLWFALICRLVAEHKILSLLDGAHENILKLKPPLCVTKEDIDYFIMCLDAVLSNF